MYIYLYIIIIFKIRDFDRFFLHKYPLYIKLFCKTKLTKRDKKSQITNNKKKLT